VKWCCVIAYRIVEEPSPDKKCSICGDGFALGSVGVCVKCGKDSEGDKTMNKQEILKILEEMIPENGEFTGDMILCLNDKDDCPNVYPHIGRGGMRIMPQMVGKISMYMTAQYTMQFVAAEHARVQARLLEGCKPEDKEDMSAMLDLINGIKDKKNE